MTQIPTTSLEDWKGQTERRLPAIACSDEVWDIIKRHRPEYWNVAGVVPWSALRPDEFGEIEGILLGTEEFNMDDLNRFHRIKVISRIGTGYDNIILPPETIKRYCFFAKRSTSLAVWLYVREMIKTYRKSWWKDSDHPLAFHLSKKVVPGVIGLGAVGSMVAMRLDEERDGKAKIITNDAWRKQEHLTRYLCQSEQMDIFKKCNLICIHIPLTLDNTNWLDWEKVKNVEDGTLIIAPVRSNVVDWRTLNDNFEELKKRKVTIVCDCEIPGWAEKLKFGDDSPVISTHHTATRPITSFLPMLDEAFDNAMTAIVCPERSDAREKLDRIYVPSRQG